MSPLAGHRTEGGRRARLAPTGATAPQPLVSVVTVVYNCASQLPATIESVRSLRRDDIEHIVVDGGSSDGTLELVESFDAIVDYWISERDAGIYDAMNKGIAAARGRFVYHLNAGDTLLHVPDLAGESVADDVICVACAVRTSDGRVHTPSVGWALRFHNTLHHQGCFYRRGPALRYDVRYQVFADFDLNQRLVNGGGRILIHPDVVALHDQGGISHTTRRFGEVYDIVRKNSGLPWVLICFAYFKVRGLFHRVSLR